MLYHCLCYNVAHQRGRVYYCHLSSGVTSAVPLYLTGLCATISAPRRLQVSHIATIELARFNDMHGYLGCRNLIILFVPENSECFPGVVNCSLIPGSVEGPSGCNCFNHYPSPTYHWERSYDECVAKAPASYKGRLAFIPDVDTFNILHSLSTGTSWIGLRTQVIPHSIPLQISEYWWTEKTIQKFPATYVPAAGEYMTTASEPCGYLSGGRYYDYFCDRSSAGYFCEFLSGNVANVCSLLPRFFEKLESYISYINFLHTYINFLHKQEDSDDSMVQ